MATFTFPAYAIRFANEGDTVLSFQRLSFEVVGPADAAFSYSVIGGDPSDLAVVDIESSTTSERIVGGPDSDDIEEDLFGRIIRANGQTHVILDLFDEDTDIDYIISVGEDPLPVLTSIASAQAFVGSIVEIEQIASGPFAPGTPIPLAGAPGVEIDGETPAIVAAPGSLDVEIPALGEPSVAGATEGPDLLVGTPQTDAIDALGGNDTVKALADDDDIDLGAGDDILLSGGGNDTIRGGDGNDTIKSAAGADLIDGGAGDDIILSGNDDDTILGGAGNDTIKPGRGNDSMDGGAGDDILVGFRGDEVLIGGDGSDTLLGNLDDDTIVGGAGDDRLQGGPGRDTFVFDTASWGDDRIVLDFLPQSDALDFRGSGLAFADLAISAAPGGNVLIEAGDSSILINSARFGPLDVADFAGDVLLFD